MLRRLNSRISYFDGPPLVSCAAFVMHGAILAEVVDVFAHPFRGKVHATVSGKVIGMRRQGFFGVAMFPMDELEYTGIVKKLETLEK